MKNSFKISFEETLLNLHGEKYRKIIEITDKTFQSKQAETENDNSYIQ
jgi:predicted nucleic-acid-binding Zn-ribbon protein